MRVKASLIMQVQDRTTDVHPFARLCAWVILVTLTTTFCFQLTTGYRFLDVAPTSTSYASAFLKYSERFPATEDEQAEAGPSLEPALTRVDLNAD
jgi:hypothetical protein